MNTTALQIDWSMVAWAGMAIKGGLVLALAGLVAMLLHRRSAAWRHLAWTAALISLPVLTLLSLLGPAWRLPVLAAPEASSLPSAVPAETPARVDVARPGEAPPAMGEDEGVPVGLGPARPAVASATPPVGGTARRSWVAWFLLAWAISAGAMCLPLVVGMLSLLRVRRAAFRPEDGRWAEPLEAARSGLRIRRKVLLLEHEHQTMPMTWGVLRPVVMLPAEARTWTAEEQRAVLLHELAHVRRYDYLTRMLARLGLALHVFNPLAWLAWRSMRTESERACDDHVLAAGADPADYADQLLQIAQHCQASQWSAASAITMARKSQLEGRILAVLDAARSRASVGRVRVAACLALAAMITVPVSIVHPVADEVPERHFVRMVVGPDRMTFQGEPVDWGDLDVRLTKVPDRASTVLEIARATDELTIAQWNQAKGRALEICRLHGFEYLSDVGLHELGSMGSDSEPRELTESLLSDRRDHAVEQGALTDALRYEMRRVLLRRDKGHAYKDKIDLAGVWEDYREAHQPEGGAYAMHMGNVENWGASHVDDPEYGWRVAHVLAAMARDMGDTGTALGWMERALEAYPQTLYPDPSKHSKFQHLVNEMAGLRWDHDDGHKAFMEAYERFRQDPRFEYFFLPWWADVMREREGEEDIGGMHTYILQGYAGRVERFPDRAGLTRKYMTRLVEETDERWVPPEVQAMRVQTAEGEAGVLQQLIDRAEPGTTVEIPDGTYGEALRVEKALTLRGRSHSRAVLKVRSDQPAIHVLTDAPVSIEELTIEWQRASSKRSAAPQAAVVAKDGPLSIVNCEFTGEAGNQRCPAGLFVDGFADLELRGCMFSGFEYAVQITGGAKGVVEDCVFIKPGHCGVTALRGAEVTARRNLVTGSAYHGMRCTGGTFNAEDNLIIANKNRGIYLGNRAAHGLVRNNLILGNASGISVFGGSDTEIRNNVVMDNSFVGIDVRSFCPITAAGNVLAGNDQGFIVWKEGNAPTVVNLGANTFWENTSNDVTRIEMPAGAILADPGFADAAHGDFSRPGTSGPGADHGLSDPAALKPVWEKWEAVKGLVGG